MNATFKDCNTVQEARNKAIEWQSWASGQDLSYDELANWQRYFATLAYHFNLTEEFKENGIL